MAESSFKARRGAEGITLSVTLSFTQKELDEASNFTVDPGDIQPHQLAEMARQGKPGFTLMLGYLRELDYCLFLQQCNSDGAAHIKHNVMVRRTIHAQRAHRRRIRT